MQRKKFEIIPDEGAILKKRESDMKILVHCRTEGKGGAQDETESGICSRSTRIDYAPVEAASPQVSDEDKDRETAQRLIPVIRYKLYDGYQELVHGFSTRFGGVSKGHLGSMNLSFSRGDEPEYVQENHRRFGDAVGYDCRRLVFSDQVHDTRIHVATEGDAGNGIIRENRLKGIDGLVTNVRGLPLITFYADCVPIYFYDPVCHVVGLAHSGWKGTVRNIAGDMVRTMQEVYGCHAEDILCAIGPSICMDCYEVSEDVAEQFREAYDVHHQSDTILLEKGEGKYQLNLHAACRYNLLGAGIEDEHIALPDLCTCCNHIVLFSHRASHGQRGNLGAVIMLKEL